MTAAPVPERVKVCQPIRPADNRLAIDQEQFPLEALGGVDNSGKAIAPIIPATREAAHPRAFPPHHESEAVMFDFMHPQGTGGRPAGLRGSARFNKSGRAPGRTL